MISNSASSAQLLSESERVVAKNLIVGIRARQTLESVAMRATFWTVADYGCAMVLRIINSLILTRLLRPELFGLMTLVTTLVVGISLLSDIGLIPSVIQSPLGDDPDFLNTVWTLQVIRSVGIFLVAMTLAWPMSVFYHDPRLVALIAALSFSVLLGGFNSTNLLSLSRHLGVGRLFVFDVSSQILTLLVTVAWALLVGRTIWALVVGNLASAIFRLGTSYLRLLVPGIRNKFRWDRESVHTLASFGKWILLGTASSFFASQSDRLILGKLVSLSTLGVYGIAYSVSDIPRAIISAFAQKVGYPIIAKIAHFPVPEFRRLFLHYRFRILLVGAFLLCLMVHLGGLLVTRMYDSRYHAASWMVPVLAIGLWHTLMYATIQPALYCRGRSNYQAIGNVCYCIATVSSILLAFHFWGIFGAVVAVAAGDLPMYVVMVIAASREGVSTWRQDVLTTAIFLVFLGLGQVARISILG